MKVLVTGGAGFIGSHLCDRLIEDGHAVVALDDLSSGELRNIQHLEDNRRFDFVQLDLLEEKKLRAFVKREGFEIIFHLAANSDIARGVEEPTVDLERTYLSTFNVARAANRAEVPEIVFTSSSAIYGPISGEISEDTGPCIPSSFYGAGKLASEGILSAWAQTSDLSVWLLRLPNVVGDRATHGVIYDFVRKLRRDPAELEVLGDGMQCKPYMYVHDVVDAIIHIWTHIDDAVNVVNIGVESRTRVRTIAEAVVDKMGGGAAIRYTGGCRGWPGDVPQYSYDVRRLAELGWTCPRSSDEAVHRAVDCVIREHPK